MHVQSSLNHRDCIVAQNLSKALLIFACKVPQSFKHKVFSHLAKDLRCQPSALFLQPVKFIKQLLRFFSQFLYSFNTFYFFHALSYSAVEKLYGAKISAQCLMQGEQLLSVEHQAKVEA